MLDPTTFTLKDAASKIHSRELTSTELTAAYLTRIRKLNPKLNAFVSVTEDLALQSARKADEELKTENYRGPLHGIPIAIKDVFKTKGIRTTAGSKILANYVPDEGASVVEKLKTAGAICLGKLNMHEWALGVTSVNPHFGEVINPWNSQCIAGGSSGGSAVALAARLCLASVATDTGGSIRIPSSFCGTVGLKPTYGCVSLRGVIPVSWSLDHVGLIARNVQDLAICLTVIAGYDEYDPTSVLHSNESYDAQLKNGAEGLRLMVPTNYFFDDVDEVVTKSVREAIKCFEALGATVTECRYDEVEEDARANEIILLAEAAAYHQQHLRYDANSIGADVLTRLKKGESITAVELALAYRLMIKNRRLRAKPFEKFDVMITPSTPTVAPPKSGLDSVEVLGKLKRFTSPFNFVGLPAISIPCGFTPEGLPIGLQLVAEPWHEAILLRAAYAYEATTDWHKRQPAQTVR